MAVVLEPGGGLWGVIAIGQAVPLNTIPWEPNEAPRAIGPGELDAGETMRRRVYWQFQSSPNMLALVAIVAQGWQAVTAEQFELSEYRYLSTAIGSTLDELGALVHLDRLGLGQELYRRAIRARGGSLTGDAGIAAVMGPAKALLGADAVTYIPAYPRAFCYLITVSVSVEMIELLVRLLTPLLGAGIGGKLLLAPPEQPGWGYSTPQVWSASWSSIYGGDDAATASPWGWGISL